MRIGTYTMRKHIVDDVPEDKLYKVIEEMTKKFGDVTVKKNYDGTFDVTAEQCISKKYFLSEQTVQRLMAYKDSEILTE